MATRGVHIYGNNGGTHQAVKVGAEGGMIIVYDSEQVVNDVMDATLINGLSISTSSSWDFGTSFSSLDLGSYWDVSTAGSVNLDISYQASHDNVNFYTAETQTLTTDTGYLGWNHTGQYGRFSVYNADAAQAGVSASAVYFKYT